MLEKYFDRIQSMYLGRYPRLRIENMRIIESLGGTLEKFILKTDKIQTSIYDYEDKEKPNNWTGSKQSYNYMMAFFALIQKAKDNGIQNLLYLEDDAKILPTFEIFLPIIMENVPKNWDMIYLCPGHHTSQGQPSNIFQMEYGYYYKSILNLNLHGVAISNRIFDRILSLQEVSWLHENPYIDITLAYQSSR